MRNIDEHTNGVHSRDDRRAVIADAAIDAFGLAETDAVLTVVRQLGTALTDVVEIFDVVDAREVIGVLQPHDYCALAVAFGTDKVGCLVAPVKTCELRAT